MTQGVMGDETGTMDETGTEASIPVSKSSPRDRPVRSAGQ